MDLRTARGLKQQLLGAMLALDGRVPLFAVGIGLTPGPLDGYKLAIRLRSEEDRALLDRGEFRPLIERAERDIDIQAIGIVSMPEPPAIASLTPEPLTIGASISRKVGRPGTLGFFAKDANGAVGLVSTNHVMADFDKGKKDDDIFSPAKADGGNDVVAALSDYYPRLRSGATQVADCAFAIINNGVQRDTSSLGGNDTLSATPVKPLKQMNIRKIGRTTKRTQGTVTTAEIDQFTAYYALTRVVFNDVIELETDAPGRILADGGDSGALVYSYQNEPVGLLFTKSFAGGKYKMGFAYANTIEHVTTELKVTLYVQ